MIGMMQRLKIQVLLKAKHTQEDVARRLDVSERSVRAIAKEPPIETLGDLASPGRVGRPSKVEGFRRGVAEFLAESADKANKRAFRSAGGDRGGGLVEP
jgi:hypothetical protein